MTVDTRAKAPSYFVLPPVLYLVAFGMFIALVTDQSGMALLCFLVFSLAAAAKVWSAVSLSRVRAAMRVDATKLFRDESTALRVEVENAKFLPVWLQVSVPLDASFRGEASELKDDAGVLAHQRVSFTWRVTAARRGVHRLGPAGLETADPLGFFPKKTSIAATDLIVYPRLIALQPIALPRRDFYGSPGFTSLVEDPAYIQGTQDYQPGRAARFIHWKASARANRLLEKKCETTEREKILIVLRVDRFEEDATGEALERCLEVAASMAVQLDRQRYAVGLATNARLKGGGNAVLKISRNPTQMSDLLETLARVEAEPATDMLEIVRSAASSSRTITVVCLSYALDSDSAALYAWFKHRRIPVVTIVADRGAQDHAVVNGSVQRVHRLEDICVNAAP